MAPPFKVIDTQWLHHIQARKFCHARTSIPVFVLGASKGGESTRVNSYSLVNCNMKIETLRYALLMARLSLTYCVRKILYDLFLCLIVKKNNYCNKNFFSDVFNYQYCLPGYDFYKAYRFELRIFIINEWNISNRKVKIIQFCKDAFQGYIK